MADPSDVPARLHELAATLAEPLPMRRGSLSERFVKCSKPGYPCAADPKARHGPYYSLTRAVRGKTQSRLLSPAESVIVRRQVETGKQFREHINQYWGACEQWADDELSRSTTPREPGKKGGSKRTSRRKSPRKSRT